MLKEYFIENKKSVNLNKLKNKASDAEYFKARENLVRTTIDLFVKYKKGILLIERMDEPAKGMIWGFGGGIERGKSFEQAIKEIARRECNLKISNIKFLGVARFFCGKNSWGSEKGVDDISLGYFAKGKGYLKLDKHHKNPIILKPENYNKDFREKIHPFVKNFLDKAMGLIKSSSSFY